MKFFIIMALLLPAISCSMEKRKAFEELQEPRPKKPKITIFQAINNGDTDEVRSLISKQPALVNVVDEKGRTPLHIAAKKNNAGIVRALLSVRPHLNAKDAKGRTPLMNAVRRGNLENVKLLVAAGEDPNLYDEDGETVLEMAFDRLHKVLIQQDSYQQLYKKNKRQQDQDNMVRFLKEANLYHKIMRELAFAGANPELFQKDKKSVMQHLKIHMKKAKDAEKTHLYQSYFSIYKSLKKAEKQD